MTGLPSPATTMSARSPLLLAASILTLSTACATGPSEPGGDAQPLLTTLPRELTTGERGIVQSANGFSFSLFRTVSAAQRDANVFVSPLSASYALGMAMNGAAGATYDQMRGALSFGAMPEADIDAGYQGLTTLLKKLDPQVELRIANSIWHDRRLPLHATFAEKGRTFFGARVEGLDFAAAGSPGTINRWVSDATAGKIPTIVESLDRDLVALLINAIYFKGSWRERFDPAKTIDAPFQSASGAQPARLMHREGSMPYLATTDFEAVDLPYGNGAYTMTVLLPRAGRSVETVAASLQPAQWSTWMSQLQVATVDLHLPRFRMEWERTLNADLQSLGMVDAFVDGGANFTRLSPAGGAFISFVLQKTCVDVSEEGTEAAAATAVGISVTSAPESVTMRVDRPFLVVVREHLSGTILFMGKVVRV
jgi:serine protease inhibitor